MPLIRVRLHSGGAQLYCGLLLQAEKLPCIFLGRHNVDDVSDQTSLQGKNIL